MRACPCQSHFTPYLHIFAYSNREHKSHMSMTIQQRSNMTPTHGYHYAVLSPRKRKIKSYVKRNQYISENWE